MEKFKIKVEQHKKAAFNKSNMCNEIEQDFKRVKEKYKFLFEHILDTILELDDRGKILHVNVQVKNLLGYQPNEVIGKKIL